MCLAIGYNEEDLFRHLLLFSIDKFFFDIHANIRHCVCALIYIYKCRKLNANEFHAKQMK